MRLTLAAALSGMLLVAPAWATDMPTAAQEVAPEGLPAETATESTENGFEAGFQDELLLLIPTDRMADLRGWLSESVAEDMAAPEASGSERIWFQDREHTAIAMPAHRLDELLDQAAMIGIEDEILVVQSADEFLESFDVAQLSPQESDIEAGRIHSDRLDVE